MEETLICPICETANAPDATHCEVCGERLVPAEPGVELSPEESVAGDIAGGGSVVGFAVEDSEPHGIQVAAADQTADFQPSAFADEYDEDSQPDLEPPFQVEGDDSAPESPGTEELDLDAAELEMASEPDVAPQFLYSPMDGTAYPIGSAEYEEGFGPNGEQLVAEAPVEQYTEGAPSEAQDDEYDVAIEDEFCEAEPAAAAPVSEGADEAFAAEVAGARAPGHEPSAEFRSAFQVRAKERPAMTPLPQPGAYVEPATLTVYVNREPVLHHAVETDEVLIGRRDPVADAYPDLDLTDFDPEAHVSRKHAYVYRQNKNYTIYAVSNAGTQLNSELLDLGDRRPLADGDVIVLAGRIAIKFELPGA